MKKTMSRILIIFIIAIMLIEFSFSNTCSAAMINSASIVNSETINLISNLLGGLVSILYWIHKLIGTGLTWITAHMLTGSLAGVDGVNGTAPTTITPMDIFFNRYKLLDVNVFDVNPGSGAKISTRIRAAVAQWYYVIRNIAAVILLIVLIYVGIRMALSTVASDRVKYRKMLWDWGVSLVLIFVLQYLAIFVIYANNAIVKMIEGLITDNPLGAAIDRIVWESLIGIGITSVMAFLVYVMITIQTILFFIAYLNRVIKIAFLVIISPLIAVTYSIDKMGDGKAQAFNNWLKEFTYTILIQPFHCIMYLAFASAAAALLVGPDSSSPLVALGFSPEVNEISNGVLAILCLKFINDGEKIIRTIFNFSDDNSSTSMAAGTALAMMAVQKAQKMGSTGKKFLGKDSAFGQALTKDINRFQGSDFGKKVLNSNFAKSLSNTTSKISNTIANSAIGRGANKVLGGANRAINGFRRAKGKFTTKTPLGRFMKARAGRQSAAVVGALTAAMMYAGGDSDALTAFSVGRKVQRLTEPKFNNVKQSAVDTTAQANAELDEAEREENGIKLSDAEEILDAAGLSDAEKDDTETLDRKADEAEENVERTKNRVAKQEQLSKLDKRIESLEKFLATPPKDNSKKTKARYANRRFELEKLKKEREQLLSQKVEDTPELLENPEVIQAMADAKVARTVSQAAHDRQDAMAFDTDESLRKRLEKRSRRVTDGEFSAMADRIMALIAEIKSKRDQEGTDDETDTHHENVINDEDWETAGRMTEKLASEIRNAVTNSRDFNVRDYVERHMGLTDLDNPNSMGYHLVQAIQDYKQLQNRDHVAQYGFGAYDKINADRSGYIERVMGTMERRPVTRPNRSESTSRHDS